jgi:hypothetical protein
VTVRRKPLVAALFALIAAVGADAAIVASLPWPLTLARFQVVFLIVAGLTAAALWYEQSCGDWLWVRWVLGSGLAFLVAFSLLFGLNAFTISRNLDPVEQCVAANHHVVDGHSSWGLGLLTCGSSAGR